MRKKLNAEMTNFGIEVRKKLLEINISQTIIAEKLGITNSYLCDILNDNRYAPDIRRKIICILNELENKKLNNVTS